jgi:hypothetical protein
VRLCIPSWLSCLTHTATTKKRTTQVVAREVKRFQVRELADLSGNRPFQHIRTCVKQASRTATTQAHLFEAKGVLRNLSSKRLHVCGKDSAQRPSRYSDKRTEHTERTERTGQFVMREIKMCEVDELAAFCWDRP